MLYHLLAPLAKQHIAFNLFNYLTFRAAGAVVTALLLAFLCAPAVIRRLRARNVGQVIRAEGPASHHAKRGTPTMGGLIIILATVVPTFLWARLDSRYVVVAEPPPDAAPWQSQALPDNWNVSRPSEDGYAWYRLRCDR